MRRAWAAASEDKGPNVVDYKLERMSALPACAADQAPQRAGLASRASQYVGKLPILGHLFPSLGFSWCLPRSTRENL